jgi:hypothetical protein
MVKIITEYHPFMKKVDQLYDLMDKLNISIEYGGVGGLNIIDTESNQSYRLKDKDTGEYLPYFPTGTEFKLSFEE